MNTEQQPPNENDGMDGKSPSTAGLEGAHIFNNKEGTYLYMIFRGMSEAEARESFYHKHGYYPELTVTSNDRVEGRDAASSRRVPSHDGLCPDGGETR